MTIFLLAMAALVAVILLTRLAPPARWVERRSVRHYEHSMEVLRSLPNRRIAENPAPEQPVLGPPGLASPPPDQPAVVDVGGIGSVPAEADEQAEQAEQDVKPAFVFVADDPGVDQLEPPPSPPGPTSIEDPTPTLRERLGAFVAAFSSTVARPRVRITAGLVTVVVGATVAGTLVSLTSSSPSRAERVRQVRSAPSAPAPPATSTIPQTPSSVEATPTTTAVPAQTDQTIEPTTTPTPTTPIPTTPPTPQVVTPSPDVSPAPPTPPTIIMPTPPTPTEPPTTTTTTPSSTTTPHDATATPQDATATPQDASTTPPPAADFGSQIFGG